eukprot:837027-Pelagomonas_calceolata.AAC.1
MGMAEDKCGVRESFPRNEYVTPLPLMNIPCIAAAQPSYGKEQRRGWMCAMAFFKRCLHHCCAAWAWRRTALGADVYFSLVLIILASLLRSLGVAEDSAANECTPSPCFDTPCFAAGLQRTIVVAFL